MIGKKFYDITDPTTLPGDPIEYKAIPKPAPILCDVGENETETVVFCVESQKKLFEQLQKVSLVKQSYSTVKTVKIKILKTSYNKV